MSLSPIQGFQGAQAPTYDPNGLNRLQQLSGIAAQQQQISASKTQQQNTLFQMAREKDALVTGAVASTLADPNSTADDIRNKLAEVGQISGDPDTQRIAAVRAAMIPDDPAKLDSFKKTDLARNMAPETVGNLAYPQNTPPYSDNAYTYIGGGIDRRTNKILSPQAAIPLQQGPEFRATPQTVADPITGAQVRVYPSQSAAPGAPAFGLPAGGTPGAQAPGGPSASLDDVANTTIAMENGIYGAAAKDPNSTAAGAAAFINKTWLSEYKKLNPGTTLGDPQILALRQDPSQTQLQLTMTKQLAQDNIAELQRKGVPIQEDTTIAAHRFGADGAAAIYNSPPTMLLSQALAKAESAKEVAQVMQANPQYAGMTVRQFQDGLAQQISQRTGYTGPGAGQRPIGQGQAPTATPAAASVAGPGAPAPQAPTQVAQAAPAAPQPGAPMGGLAAPPLTLAPNLAAFQADKEQVPVLVQQNQNIDAARQALQVATTGKGTQGIQTLRSIAASFGFDPPGADVDAKAAAYDIFNKITAQLKVQAAGPRANELRTELATIGTAGPDMNKTAAFALLNKQIAQNRQIIAATSAGGAAPADYLNQKNQFLGNTDYRAFGLDKYTPEEHTALQQQLNADTTGGAMKKFKYSAAQAAPYLGQ